MKVYTLHQNRWAQSTLQAIDESSRCLIVMSATEVSDPSYSAIISLFDIHELELIDLTRSRHVPKYEEFGSNSLLIQREFVSDGSLDDVRYLPISCCWSEGHCLVVHQSGSEAVIELEDLPSQQDKFLEDPVELVIWVSQAISRSYLKRLQAIEERLEELEDELEQRLDDQFLHEVLGISTMLKKTSRTLRYQRAALKGLTDCETQGGFDTEHHFQDMLEAVDRVSTLSLLLSEISSDLMNAFLSLHAHRLNRIMQILTVCTVVFLPLSLIAGIYGMNFTNMPELSATYGYPLVLSSMLLCAVTILFVLKRLKWT